MSDHSERCERCGDTLAAGAFGDACPRCLLELGLGPSIEPEAGEPDSQPFRVDATPSIAHYRILGLIGEGGMGCVYEAEQDHPRRTVALKIIKPGLSHPKLLRRFEQESQALGRLQHPGIAQIYEAGTADTGVGSQPYFAMELIRGKRLDAHVSAADLDDRERLTLVSRIADAVHHAHQRGVIHRDLKPANIIVDETGQPKILDFGIARAIDSDTRATSHTDVGQLVGTLTYMSPEQTLADPLGIDTRSDVYALGVILYELLARRPPYAAARTLSDTVRAIRDEEPIPLGVVSRKFRGDVETIVATALEKERTRRYGSAADLAADIRRYLTNQPIVARPPSAAYQLRKFAQRNRAFVGATAAVAVALLLGLIASIWQASVADRERDRARAAELAATTERNAALEAKQQATRELDRAVAAEQQFREERDRALAAEAELRLERDHALAAETRADVERGRTSAAEQAEAAQRQAMLEAERVAARERERAVTADTQRRQDRERSRWQRLARESIRLSTSRTDDDLAALLARQAFLLATRPRKGRADMLVEDALQHASRVPFRSHAMPAGSETGIVAAAFSPDATRLATNGADGGLELWDLRRPFAPPRILANPSRLGIARFSAFSPDGTLLATGGVDTNAGRGAPPVASSIRIWDLRGSNPTLVQLFRHTREVNHGAFSPDGNQLVTTNSAVILLWDLRNPAAAPRVLRPKAAAVITFVAFSPDGSRLLTIDRDGIRLWDMRNPVSPVDAVPGSSGALRAVLSPDGTLLAATTTDGVRLWDLRRPGAPRTMVDRTGANGAVAFSGNGSRLAAAVGATVYVWEVRDPGSKPLTLLGHQALVLPIAFTPDASRLLSFGLDTTVRIWELQQAGAPFVLAKGLATALGVDPILSFAFSSDDTRLYGGVRGGAVSAWELRSSAPPVRVPVPTTALASHRPPAASLFRTGDCRAELIARAMSPLAYRPPEHDIARAVTGVDAPPLSGGPTMQLSPDGRELAVGPRDADAVCVWNFEDRTGRSLSLRRSPGITQVWYSPDGSRLAAANALEIRIWNRSNFDSAPLVIPQLPQTKDVHAVAFSIDNRFVAVGTGDVRVYDLQRPENVLVLRSTPNRAPSALVFAGDGELLVAGSVDGATHLWDVREPSAPPLVLPGEGWVTAVQLSGNGRRLAIAHSNGGADLWTLGAEAAEDLCRRTLRNLTVEEWRRYVGDDLPYERTCSGLAAPGTP